MRWRIRGTTTTAFALNSCWRYGIPLDSNDVIMQYSQTNPVSYNESCCNRTTKIDTWGTKLGLTDYRLLANALSPGMPGTFSPPLRVSDPDMHQGTCVMYVPWCMPGSLTSGFLWSRSREKTFPAFPAHAQPAILRTSQEAHGTMHQPRTILCVYTNRLF